VCQIPSDLLSVFVDQPTLVASEGEHQICIVVRRKVYLKVRIEPLFVKANEVMYGQIYLHMLIDIWKSMKKHIFNEINFEASLNC